MSRFETMLTALLNGETVAFEPQSRIEKYLKNCLDKCGCDGLPAPTTRAELALYQLAEEFENGGVGGSTSLFGRKMYTFGVLSDIHIGYESRGGTADFQRAIPALQNLGVEFVCITGDVGYYSDSSSVIEELQGYRNALDTYATVPFYTVTGNHDIKHSDSDWELYTGHPKNFEIVKDGDVFLFMSLTQSEKASSHATPYTTSLTWLKERLSYYQGARIFVFMHYPISGYAGLRDGDYYGFSSESDEDDELLSSLIATKNAVVFNGHTHFKLDCESDHDIINVFTFQHKNVSLVHVPSCAYPRNYSKTEEANLSEGYVVEVYENGVILRGVDLVKGEYMPDYEYALTIDNNTVVTGAGAIMLSTNEISLKSGESAEIEVHLTNPLNATVTISESNKYITVSPALLNFTKDNYNIPQKIVVTASDIDASESTMITVGADELISKTISVALTSADDLVTAISGVMTPETNTVYGGVCGSDYSKANQLYTDKNTGGEFSFTFRGLTLKSLETALYMAGNSITTVMLEGVNTIDTSGSSKTTQRAISSSGTKGNFMIGVGEDAELIVKNRTDASAAIIKGDWTIENAKITATGSVDSTSKGIAVVNTGITLRRLGEFSLNGSAVRLIECEGGYLEVNLASATAGKSALAITAHANDGYTLTAIKVNGVEQSADATLTMPATNETMTIQGIFTN